MSLGNLIYSLVNIYTLLIFIYCIFSWFPIPRDGIMADISAFLDKVCDPYLSIFRKFIPSIGGAVDISPIIALVVLQFVAGLLIRFL